MSSRIDFGQHTAELKKSLTEPNASSALAGYYHQFRRTTVELNAEEKPDTITYCLVPKETVSLAQLSDKHPMPKASKFCADESIMKFYNTLALLDSRCECRQKNPM